MVHSRKLLLGVSFSSALLCVSMGQHLARADDLAETLSPTSSLSPTPTPEESLEVISIPLFNVPQAEETSVPYSVQIQESSFESGLRLDPYQSAPTSCVSYGVCVSASPTSLPLCSYQCNFQGRWEVIRPPSGSCDSSALPTLPVPCPTPIILPSTPTPYPSGGSGPFPGGGGPGGGC